jgi:argininosuccinate lyase
MKVWNGRFTAETASLMEAFSSSIGFDRKLVYADLAVNRAWARVLAKAGVYSDAELKKALEALDAIDAEIRAGTQSFSDQDEDIHSATERWLTQKIGDLGARIHTGRSRNDQVVTDTRLYVRTELEILCHAIAELQEACVALAKKHVNTVMPGFTHLRQAQPVCFAHYLLALFFQMERNQERLRQCHKRVNVLPLGSGALAGAGLAIDRQALADALGFAEISENAMDATADRDFVTETLFVCAQIMLHLSRYAEDLIMWSAEAFGYVQIDDAYATGSSMMPQKKNPDSLELIRGKTARVIGDHTTLLALMKGIPSAYVRDLQEDKESLFDALEQTRQSVLVMGAVLGTLTVNPDKMRASIDPALYATDLADYLVMKGVPFREAHRVVGQLVTTAEQTGKTLAELDMDVFHTHSPFFDDDVRALFDPHTSLKRRNIDGGTGPEAVRKQLEKAERALQKEGSGRGKA